MAAPVVIHRDHTFTANGRQYRVVGGATPEDTAQYGYEIEDHALVLYVRKKR